jgi:hypothetical protein
MDLHRISRYIADMQQQVSAASPVNTPPTSINIATSTASNETPSNVSANSSSQLTPSVSVSTSSTRRQQTDQRQSTSSTGSASDTPPPVKQTRIQDLLESSSDDDISEVKNDDDNDCLIVGTTPPPNRFRSQYSPQSQYYSPSTPSSQRRRRQGMYYCKHCESDTGCHNSVYGGFLEKKFGDTSKGLMNENEVYEEFLLTYKNIREFSAHNDILEKKNGSIFMLPYCMYVGTFKRCLTNHVVAGQYAERRSNKTDASAQAHLNWVRARSEQTRNSKRRKRNNCFR